MTSGFLRSSNRTLAPGSTELDPIPTYLAADRQNLPAGQFTLVRIPIDPIAHTFRAGTRLRIVISAPGGDRPSWSFQTFQTHGSVVDTVAAREFVSGRERGVGCHPDSGDARVRGTTRRALQGLLPHVQPDLSPAPLSLMSLSLVSLSLVSLSLVSAFISERRFRRAWISDPPRMRVSREPYSFL